MLRCNLTEPKLYQSLAEFRHQIRRFLAYSERAARAEGLEPQQHQFLLAIKGLPPGATPTVKEIAARLEIRPNTALELAHRMEAGGLITRRVNREDRREVLLSLTRSGEASLKRLSLAHRAELRELGPELMRALKKVLKQS